MYEISNFKIIKFLDKNPDFDWEQIILIHIETIKKHCKVKCNEDCLSEKIDLKFKEGIDEFIKHGFVIGKERNQETELRNDLSLKEFELVMNFENQKIQQGINDTQRSIHETQMLLTSQNIPKIHETQIRQEYTLLQIEKVTDEMSKYLERMKISKGNTTENKFELLLENGLQGFTVEKIPSIKQRGQMDFRIQHEGKPDILLDIKDYTKAVPKAEVSKFEKDVLLSGHHGILLSPHASISGKHNFQINTVKDKVVVYISNTSVDISDIIKAIRVIYYIDDKISSTGKILSTEDISSLNKSINEIESRLDSIKVHLNLAISDLNKCSMDSIKVILELSSKREFKCEKCNADFTSGRILTKHEKICKKS